MLNLIIFVSIMISLLPLLLIPIVMFNKLSSKLKKPKYLKSNLLDDWEAFAKKVVLFGHCDGFAKLVNCSIAEYNVDMSYGWQHQAPDHYLLIKPCMTEINLKIDRNDAEDNDEDENYRDNIGWIVDVKAGLVTIDSKLPVRSGFWTRVVSENLEVALNKTYSLWELECKNNSNPPKRNDSKYFLCNLIDETSIYNMLSYYDSERMINKFKKEFKMKDWFYLWENLKKKEKELNTFKKLIKNHLEDVSNLFDKFIIEKQKTRKTRRKSNEKGVDFKSFEKAIKEENLLLKKMLDVASQKTK